MSLSARWLQSEAASCLAALTRSRGEAAMLAALAKGTCKCQRDVSCFQDLGSIKLLLSIYIAYKRSLGTYALEVQMPIKVLQDLLKY